MSQQQVVAANFGLAKYLAAKRGQYSKSSIVLRFLSQLEANPAVAAACTSKVVKLSRDFYLGPLRDSVPAEVSADIREEVIADLIAIDEQNLEVYNGTSSR